METIIILILFTLVIFGELVPNIKKKSKSTIIVYSSFILASFIILFVESIGINLSGATDFIKDICEKFVMKGGCK